MQKYLGKDVEATYDYHAASGELLYQVVRFTPKGFVQRRPDGRGGWVPGRGEIRPVLYRLPELLAKPTWPVILVEGEKDADALRKHGFLATTVPGGANQPWRDEYGEVLRDRTVAIIPDNDHAGREFARKMAEGFRRFAKTVQVTEIPDLPDKGDVSTFFEQGGQRVELIRYIKETPKLTEGRVLIFRATNEAEDSELEESGSPDEDAETEPRAIADGPQSRSQSLKRRDSGTRVVRAWEVEEPAPVSFLWADLIPNGFATSLYGDGGNGKSYLALALACHVALGRRFLGRAVERGPVLYLDAELNDRVFLSRAYSVARGMQLDAPPEGLHYLQLRGSLLDETAHRETMQAIESIAPRLVIVDSLTVAAFDADPTDAGAIATVMKVLARFGTVLVLDHIAKPSPGANQSNYRQFGSVFKGNLVRSAIQAVKADGGGLLLQHKKTNFGTIQPPIGVSIGFSADSVFLGEVPVSDSRLAGASDHMPAKEQVALALEEGPATAQQIADTTDIPLKTVKNALTALKQDPRRRIDNVAGEWSIRTDSPPEIERSHGTTQVPESLRKGTGTGTGTPVTENLLNLSRRESPSVGAS